MKTSESIVALAAALSAAQAEMEGAKKGSTNPHFRSAYADLASVWDAVREPLTKHGLSVVQFPRLVAAGESGWLVDVETTLLHKSGEYLTDSLAIPVTKVDAQGVGSAITYARRYALGAVAGIAPEDDDGNAAVGTNGHAKHEDAPPAGATEIVTVKVLGVTQRPVGANSTKYTITASDQKTYSTLKKVLAERAKAAQEAGSEIEIRWKQTNYGRDVLDLSEVGQAEPAF